MRIFSAGIVPIFFQEKEPRVLLLRAYRNWDFPKGVVEEGEGPLQGALRELKEETSISKVVLPFGAIYRETTLPKRNKTVRYYVAECSSRFVRLPFSAELGRPEHHEYRWVRIPEARSLVSARLIPVLDWLEELLRRSNRKTAA